jgi:hypothetical protein
MKATTFAGTAELVASMNEEFDRLLNLIDSRLKRKEVALAEEFAEELLKNAMNHLLRQKAAKMNKLNRVLLLIMKLLLVIVFVSLLFTVMNIQPFFGLKVFVAGASMIAFLVVVNYYLFRRFWRGVHLMLETYEKESKRFIGLLLDSIRVTGNPETALDIFRLSIMR